MGQWVSREVIRIWRWLLSVASLGFDEMASRVWRGVMYLVGSDKVHLLCSAILRPEHEPNHEQRRQKASMSLHNRA